MRRTTLIAAAFITAAAAAPAFAQSEFTFKYQEHELATAGGQKALMNRLEDRIEAFCTTTGRKSLTAVAAEEDCVDETMEDVLEKISETKNAFGR